MQLSCLGEEVASLPMKITVGHPITQTYDFCLSIHTTTTFTPKIVYFVIDVVNVQSSGKC